MIELRFVKRDVPIDGTGYEKTREVKILQMRHRDPSKEWPFRSEWEDVPLVEPEDE
jgi:hypothetical protein